ncbi:MAG: EAL domain-containing protein, partial [Myxococcales bacterium]|nr:EAL domain-containing protein [Myxococcales bacterium]
LKIDRAFVSGIGKHRRDEQVVELVLKIAESFEMTVVAEGVESADQLRWLEARSCHCAQGFHIGRPASPTSLMDLAERHERRGMRRTPLDGTSEADDALFEAS